MRSATMRRKLPSGSGTDDPRGSEDDEYGRREIVREDGLADWQKGDLRDEAIWVPEFVLPSNTILRPRDCVVMVLEEGAKRRRELLEGLVGVLTEVKSPVYGSYSQSPWCEERKMPKAAGRQCTRG